MVSRNSTIKPFKVLGPSVGRFQRMDRLSARMVADPLTTKLRRLGVHVFVHHGRGIGRELADDLFEYVFERHEPLNIAVLVDDECHAALVALEFSNIQGLVTLEDILEEIVGEFTTDPATMMHKTCTRGDGSFVVNGSATIRALNRSMRWNLPTDGPKT